MPRYEVKAWVNVEADDENHAVEVAGDLLDTCIRPGATSIEGREAVYELDPADETDVFRPEDA